MWRRMQNDASTHSADIHDALQTESLSKAAWMLSCSLSRISFAKSNRGIQNERLFSAEQFHCTLRSKLGAGPIESTPHTEFTCQCNAVYCPRDDSFHGCHCNINKSFCMRRHNEIQRALRDYTKKCLGLSDRAVHLKAYAGTTTGTDLTAPKRVIADISVIVGAETLWIDVSVVDATTTSNSTAPMKSRMQPRKLWRQQSGTTTSLSKTPSHSHPHL